MIDSNELVSKAFPALNSKPRIKRKAQSALSNLIHEKEINAFVEHNSHLSHLDFLERVNEYLGLSYSISNTSLENIPTRGRVVIISNHPLGSLDGLALLAMVHSIRKDVKIVVNELLWALEPLRPFFLRVNNMGGVNSKEKLRQITDSLNDEQAVIFFPAGEVSRLTVSGIKDGKWRSGFLKMAKQTQSPVLPVYVGGSNSAFFYALSMIAKPISALWLVREMFKNRSLNLPIKVGKLIPYSSFAGHSVGSKDSLDRFKSHVYRIKNSKEELFETEQPIAHPESRKVLLDALARCQPLGETPDGKGIYLLKQAKDSALMREIGRLREIAFRAVGEGTGNRRDLDKYDYYYQHIILWDDTDLEIVGSYRIADISKLSKEQNLYSETLFSFEDCLRAKFPIAMELGRSFVQPQYWGKRSLDYLWQGIGAYLRDNPHVRYLFGPVSLSNDFPAFAKDLMIYYFSTYFCTTAPLARSFNSYHIKPVQKAKLEKIFAHLDQKEAFKALKSQMSELGVSVPTLFKQYSELCDDDGVQFYDFGIDPDFGDCVDSVVWVDMLKLKPKKRQRYLGG